MLQVVGSGNQENHNTIEVIAFALDYSQEVKGEFLLLKIPCVLDTNIGGTELNLTGKLLIEN